MSEENLTCEMCGKRFEDCVCHVAVKTTVGSIRNWQRSSDRIGRPDNQLLDEANRKIMILEQKIAEQQTHNNQLIRRINQLEQEKEEQF